MIFDFLNKTVLLFDLKLNKEHRDEAGEEDLWFPLQLHEPLQDESQSERKEEGLTDVTMK